MLNKLLKYDLKYMTKSMSVFYILTVFFAILTRILYEMNQTVMVVIIEKISLGCLIAMLANILINTIMRCFVRFKDSIYKDESYLTHTLPVSKKDIYESKFLLTIIFLFIGFIFIILGLFICYYSKDNWIVLKNYINEITNSLNINTSYALFAFIFILFLEMFNIIQCGYFGIINGFKKNDNKIVYSVIFGYITYLITQTIVLIFIFIYGLINGDVMALFTSNTIKNIDVVKSLLILSIVAYTTISIFLNYLCVKFLNKGVNVE